MESNKVLGVPLVQHLDGFILTSDCNYINRETSVFHSKDHAFLRNAPMTDETGVRFARRG